MVRRILLTLTVFVFATGFMTSQTKEKPKEESAQRVKFDPTRDSQKDLEAAMMVAAKESKNILLDVGGEWCSWCHKLDAFFEQNTDVAGFLHDNYVVVKVNYSKENKNEKFLAKYPEIKGYPHLFVLDSKGELLHSQDTGLLESGKQHDHDKVFTFLKKWAPRRPS